ncbi:hypothetical protein ONJ45_26205, partial [Salmonella enterica subsp. enterica serovar Virginia]|nr:hypothetical protein [Salmonella enterica subsp. enterica serovar Virginia]
VSRVLPGMQAAFVDIGLDKAAFLHASDIMPHTECVAGDEQKQYGSGCGGSGFVDGRPRPRRASRSRCFSVFTTASGCGEWREGSS